MPAKSNIAAHLLEYLNDGPVDKVPQEELVSTGNRDCEVPQSDRSPVFLGVWPVTAGRHHDADHVNDERDTEILH